MAAEKSFSPSAARTLTVLETLVRAEDGLTLSALSKESGVSLATCASIVYTLEQRGYAARTIIGRSHFWRASLGLYGLAVRLVRNVDLSSIAQDELRELADEINMPVHIGVLSGSSVVYVAKGAADGFIQFNTFPGKMAPFNLTALGKAIAAHLDDDRITPLLSELTSGEGPGAIAPGAEAFLRQLDDIRSAGYALESEEEVAGISCVAVPFFDSSGDPAGSVGVTGFTQDVEGDRFGYIVDQLQKLGRSISGKLGGEPHRPRR